MFDAERLLGGLISQGLGVKRQRRNKLKWSLGVGAVGLAIAAWEHFNKSEGSAASSEPTPAPPASSPQPPPPPPPEGSGAPATETAALLSRAPPPPPPASYAPAPRASQPTPGTTDASTPDADRSDDAMLLIRAMICAANADGMIDAKEQSRIIEKLVTAGLGNEERAFLAREFAAPPDPKALFSSVRDLQLAEQIYTVSRLTVDVDVAQEHAYLSNLAGWLGLAADRVAELELRMLGQST